MASPFVTPSNGETPTITVKQEPLDLDYTSPVSSVHPPSLPSPIQLPMLIKFRHDLPRNNRSALDKMHSCCEVCQGEFTDQDLLLQHKLLHFNTSHVCYICDCYFVNTSTLIMHIATNHRSLNPAMTGRSDPDRSFICSICLQRFSSSKTLQRHQEVHKMQDERSFCCKICGLDFIGYRALVPHLNSTRHKEMKIKIQSIFVCVDCRSVFPSRDSYAMHMMMRAQNETCSGGRCGGDPSTTAAPTTADRVVLDYKKNINNNGWSQRSTSSPQSHSTDSRSDTTATTSAVATAPLNLSANLSPTQLYKGLTCVKCGETVPDEEALALHLMVHVREATEKPYYGSRQQMAAKPSAGSNKRSNSSDDKTYQLPPNGLWTCHVCTKPFDSCDLLAMHMIDDHTLVNGVDHANGRTNAAAEHAPDTTHDVASTAADTPKTFVPKMMPPEQACFSARSTPVSRKRPSTEDDDESAAKRCKSVDSSTFSCAFCDKQFPTKHDIDTHYVDDHAVSPNSALCLVCTIPFRSPEALKSHLDSRAHQATAAKAAETSCRVCEFRGRSSAQIREHELLHGIIPSVGHDFVTASPKQSLIGELLNDGNATREAEPPTDTTDTIGDDGSKPANHDDSDKPEPPDQNSLSRRSKRKPRISARFIRGLVSPSASENDHWMDETSLPAAFSHHPLSMSPRQQQPAALPPPPTLESAASFAASLPAALWANSAKYKTHAAGLLQHSHLLNQQQHHDSGFPRPIVAAAPTGSTAPANMSTSNPDDGSDVDLIDFVLSNSEKLVMCKYCKIIFTDQTMFYLHMGLHNLNDPWQCNLCGKANRNVHEFTSHVIHY